ncbi:MAG TPA: calcium-binding protein [Labilithrix sp.]
MIAVIVPACAAADGDVVGETSEQLETVFDHGAGAGPEKIHVDPCAAPERFAKDNGYNLIVAKAGEHTIHGTNGRDLIVGTDGDDQIFAEGGDDIVCAGYGEDVVHGGPGDDWLDGGGDNDTIYGDEGNDLLHGRGGSDFLHGGAGDDQIFGDILDDHLFGDDGDDLLVGGHGTDVMEGGPGDDFLRGDTGNDSFFGGAGRDVASFTTAMPPGQPDVVGHANKVTGVKVDMTNDCVDNAGKKHDGCANGDGGNEPLDGIEIVLGSPYDDAFTKGGTDVKFIGGYGADECDGKACGTALPAGADGKVFVSLDDKARDTGILVRGTGGADALDIVLVKDDFVVRGASLFAGPGCTGGGGEVHCNPSHVLRWIAAWGGDGDDTIKLAEAAGGSRAFPVDMTTHVSGGDGSDHLFGGDEQDVLFTGPTGTDHLFGGAGGDALLSESRKWPKKMCAPNSRDPRCDEDKPDAAHYTDGADELDGGPGDDQLVADYPCGGHHYSGGGGKDIAGFARSGSFDLYAQLAGAAAKVTAFHGKAYNPQLCGDAHGTRMEDDLEILEASSGNDLLYGNDKPNVIWGREGNDRIHGLGGDDVLEGLVGDDWIWGGAGNDVMTGAPKNQMFQDAE